MSVNTIKDPETYRSFESELEDENNLFQCNRCGHYVGDPRSFNWYGTCPECEHTVRFFRLIE
jgi:rubrerythrin